MKQDTSGIIPDRLAHFINDAYALKIAAMTFQPKGEASYSYLAVEKGGMRWLIKVQDTACLVDLEARLRAVRFVHDACGLSQVIAPRTNRLGDCTCHYERYTVTVYPFIDGDTIEPESQTEAYVSGFATLLGRFHKLSRLPFPIPRETFDYPYEDRILHVLRTVETPGRLANATQERLRGLMLAQRSDIFRTLGKMRQLQVSVRRLELDVVLTHGDPNWANILVDRVGVYRMLDWEDVALGPPERDLVFFSDREPGRFEAFLRQYLAVIGDVRLHPEVFAYYNYLWVVQEIADYTTRILFRNVDPAEDQHAWAELQPYVPAYHDAIVVAVHQIEELLARIAKG